jgi:hypothetical protein
MTAIDPAPKPPWQVEVTWATRCYVTHEQAPPEVSYGNITSQTNATNGDRFKFAGMEYDSTAGLYYDHARAPRLRVGLSEDRLVCRHADTHGNAALEFHDSDIAAIEDDGQKITIRFAPAYVHRSSGVPGTDPGTGWSQDAVMVLSEGKLRGDPPRGQHTIASGSAKLSNASYDDLVPVPLSHVGDVHICFLFDDGSEINIHAQAMSLSLVGAATYVEDFPGSRQARQSTSD